MNEAIHSPAVPSRLPWFEHLTVCLLAAVPILVKLACYPTYPGSDDAFIHMTIVRNVTHGLGWGINPGEPINLSSSPLYTILLTLLNLCGLPVLAAGEGISAASGFFSLLLLHRLLVRLGLRPTACLAGLVVGAFNLYLWRWNAVVMETTLSLFLLTLAYWVYHGADALPANGPRPAWRYLAAGLAAGLATLTRFELALVLGCFGLNELCNRPPRRWMWSWLWLTAGFLTAVVPWFAFCHFYFHGLLPTTFYAKTSHGLLWWNPAVATDLAKLTVSGDAVPILGLLVLAAMGLRRGQSLELVRTIRPQLDVFLFPVLLSLFYYTKTPSLQSAARYFLPALHLLAAVLACLCDPWSRWVPAPRLRTALAGVLCLHALLALSINQAKVVPILSRFRENYWQTAREAAAYLKTEAATGHGRNVLVEVDIGMLSYYAGDGCYFIDGGALASPALLNKTVSQHVEETRPDFVIETLGARPGALIDEVPALQLVWHQSFHSHSLTNPAMEYTTNIYANHPATAAR